MNVRNMNQEEKVSYMLSEPVPHLVCQMAVPTIISMLVTSFYNMVDTFFVGKINTQATAAVGVVFSVMAFIQACGFCGALLSDAACTGSGFNADDSALYKGLSSDYPDRLSVYDVIAGAE